MKYVYLSVDHDNQTKPSIHIYASNLSNQPWMDGPSLDIAYQLAIVYQLDTVQRGPVSESVVGHLGFTGLIY